MFWIEWKWKYMSKQYLEENAVIRKEQYVNQSSKCAPWENRKKKEQIKFKISRKK